MVKPRLAVIGGSGLYSMEGLQDVEEVEVSTPYGSPSDAIVVGTFEGVGVAFCRDTVGGIAFRLRICR